jgi:hypothetical protein
MATLTYKHAIDNANSFVNAVESERNSYYVWVGRPYPYDDEMVPPVSNSSVDQTELTVYDDIVYGKLIFPENVIQMVPRYNWMADTAYAQYDQFDGSLHSKNFFVVTAEKNVFKVIDNANGAVSTVKPSLTKTSGNFATSDGYVWKYMYTIDDSNYNKFATNEYIPLVPNTEVSNNAVVGSLDYIRVNQSGIDYRTYDNGYIQSVVNNYVVQISNSASTDDGFYVGSSIYLKAGGGAGQIRTIRSYSGLDRTVNVNQPFDTYVTLNLSDVQGSIDVGQTVTQRLDNLSYLYKQGYFNTGDTVNQTDTGAVGLVASANNTNIVVVKTSSNSFSMNTPIYNTNQGGVLKTGVVSVNTSSNVVVGTGTAFTTDYSVGQYIRVGIDQNKNIRRITGITNTTYMTVANVFNSFGTANVHYSMPYAVTPSSCSVVSSSGTIIDTNLNGLILAYKYPSTTAFTYTVGEKVDVVNGSGISQLANGTVTFSNSSTVILSEVQGTFTSNLYLKGLSSLLISTIDSSASLPNITVSSTHRTFVSGQRVIVSTVGSNTGNAIVASSFSIPNEQTEYIISPTVVIDGDGTGALAYSQINPVSNSVDRIVMLNLGTGYTKADISLVANSVYGSNAVLKAVISPVNGHGYDAADELGGRYVGVNMTYDVGENEGWTLPSYGSYRRLGILENPKHQDAILTFDTFQRSKIALANVSTAFETGEVVIQSAYEATGVVVYANSTFMELRDIGGGQWTANTSSDDIYGFNSGATANVLTYTPSYFSIGSNAEIVSELTSGATGRINEVISNTSVRLTDIYGHLNAGDVLYEPYSNAYANVVGIASSNGLIDSTYNYGHKLNQACRITLTTNTDSYHLYEYVNQQTRTIPPVVLAKGRVFSTNNEVDLSISISSGSFNVGQELTAAAGGSGVITYANTTYLKLTNASGNWDISDTINTITGTGSILTYYPCLMLHDIQQKFNINGDFVIYGVNSGSVGVVSLPLSVKYPDLIRETGKLLYTNNILPFDKTADSKEEFKLVIKF